MQSGFGLRYRMIVSTAPHESELLRKCPRCPAPLPLDEEHFYRRRDGLTGGFHCLCKVHHCEAKRDARRRRALRVVEGAPDMPSVLRVIAYGSDGLEEVRRLAATTLREVQAHARRA